MRRLALLAAALAVACSSKKDEGDKTPPPVPIVTAPAAGDTIAAADLVGGRVAFAGTAEAGATVEVQVDGAAAGSAVASATGSWQLTATRTLADASHAVSARATDAAGNASAYSSAVSFTLDATAPPVPTVSFPADGATLGAASLDLSGFLAISGGAEAGATVTVELDGVTAGTATADSGGTWSLAVIVNDRTEPAYTVRARATDAAGNPSALSAPVSFTLETGAPAEPLVEAPAQGALLGPSALVSGAVRFSGSAEPGATVALEVDDGASGTATADANGDWSVDVAVTDGLRSVRAVATDAAGNASGPSLPVTFTVDTTPPAVPAVTAPGDGDALVWTDLDANGKVVVSGTAEAGATVDVELDGQAAGSAVAAANRSWSVAVAFTGGPSHSVKARATDPALNASALSGPVVFTLDATRLAVALPAGAPAPVTSWGQTVGVTIGDPSGLGEQFPNQANSWVLGSDFSLDAGNGLEYANALVLFVGTPTGPLSHGVLTDDVIAGTYDQFRGGQDASEVTFLTPLFGEADGVVTAAVSDGATMTTMYRPPLSGTLSGYLNGTSDSRLSQTLALDPAQTYTFSWTDRVELHAGSLLGAPAPSYQVVLRDPATGAVVGAPLYSSTSDVAGGVQSVTRSGLPASVVLSFELRSAEPGYAEIDEVAVTTGGTGDVVTNGGFELGLQDWQANGGAECQNVRSGTRDVGAVGSTLRVSRTFYAPPASPWGRLVDVFENTGTADVATTAVYLTTLAGMSPAAAVTTDGKALVGWDDDASVRDVGLVYGNGSAWLFDGTSGSDSMPEYVFVTHELTVPAGGKVAVLHFVVQLGEAAGGLGSATATECANVVAGYPALEPYRQDFEPGVRALVANF